MNSMFDDYADEIIKMRKSGMYWKEIEEVLLKKYNLYFAENTLCCYANKNLPKMPNPQRRKKRLSAKLAKYRDEISKDYYEIGFRASRDKWKKKLPEYAHYSDYAWHTMLREFEAQRPRTSYDYAIPYKDEIQKMIDAGMYYQQMYEAFKAKHDYPCSKTQFMSFIRNNCDTKGKRCLIGSRGTYERYWKKRSSRQPIVRK